MEFFTTQIGTFPLGIWLSVMIIGLIGGANLLFQAISIFNWRFALKLRVQEHAPDDPDLVNRVHMVMEWGHAFADVVSHIVLVPLSIFLTIQGNSWGFVLSTCLYIFYFYVGILLPAQRFGLVKFGLKRSFKEYLMVIMIYWIVFVTLSLVGAMSLWSNTAYFAL